MAQPRKYQTFYSRSKNSVCTSLHHDLATRSTTAERATLAATRRILSGEFASAKVYNTETGVLVFHLRGTVMHMEITRKKRNIS